MPLHDAYARVTPYELAFPSLEWGRRSLAEIRDEAMAQGLTLDDPAKVLALDATHRAIDALRSRDSDAADIHSLALLLGHALLFWSGEEKLVLLASARVRAIVETPLAGTDALARSSPASGYVQLPHRMVWLASEDDEAPESVDGFFWSLGSDARLSSLLVIGMRSNRDGFGVVPLQSLRISDALEAELRESPSGADGRSLPGSELESLVTLATAADALRLILGSLIAALCDEDELAGEARDEGTGDPRDANAPAPSALPYRRVDVG